MFSSLVALPCWGPSMRALEGFQSLPDFQQSMCLLSIQSPIARFTMLYSRPSTGLGPVNGVSAPFLASLSAFSLPKMPSCPGTHTSWTELCTIPVNSESLKFISTHDFRGCLRDSFVNTHSSWKKVRHTSWDSVMQVCWQVRSLTHTGAQSYTIQWFSTWETSHGRFGNWTRDLLVNRQRRYR